MADKASGRFTVLRALIFGCLLMLARPGMFTANAQRDASLSDSRRDLDREVLDIAISLIQTETDEAFRMMMASQLFTRCGISQDALAQAEARLGGYVPVLALGGDPSQPPALQAVPRTCFSVDDLERPLGCFGPRVSIRLPEMVAVRVDPGTGRVLESVPNPLRVAACVETSAIAAGSGARDPSLAMATAFVTGTRVIGAAERWVGHRVDWGCGGQLTIIAYASVTDAPLAEYRAVDRQVYLGALGSISDASGLHGFTGRPHAWPKTVTDLLVDTVRNPDVVAHEAGHAVVSALKPGWGGGVALILHEALADMIAVLTALEDPAVLKRALRETGGDLRRANEAARLYEDLGSAVHRFGDEDPSNDDERSLRSVLGLVRPGDLALDPEDVDLPPMFAVGGRAGDPHCGSHIVSGLLYEVFCRRYEEERAAGSTPERAVLDAQSVVGALMLGSLPFVGEHRVSLRDFALALLRTDRDSCGGRCHDALREGLEARGLLTASENVNAEFGRRDAALPVFELSPDVKDPGEVLARVEALESAQLRRAKAATGSSVALVRFNPHCPFGEEARAEDVEVWSDVTSRDGVRILRLHYQVATVRLLPPCGEGNSGPDRALLGEDCGTSDVFVSLVFNSQGKLIAFNADKPWQ